MRRWEDFLKEQPSNDLTVRTEARVFAEMTGLKPKRRWFLELAALAAGAAAVVGGFHLSYQGDDDLDLGAAGLVELAEEEDLDLEMLEDLDVIEILEELEQWTS
jgi:hypothetical protein